jgi:3-oxoacyl-[acyl-carrier protein] reductase
LKDRVALVLGGSRGIGAAIVRRLAAEGASIALTYLTSPEKAAEVARAVAADGGSALAIRADSADAAAVKAAVDQVLGQFGRLDILAVNAGILLRGTVDAFSLDDFDRMVATNIRGVFAAIHFAAPTSSPGRPPLT